VNINNISKIFLQNTAIIGELITAECASVLMFIFRVHRGQVGPDLSGQVLGCEGQWAKNLALMLWMITGMDSMFRVSCRWEVGMRLGYLPMVRRHFDWVTWSLRYV